MVKFDKTIYLTLLFKLILSERLSNSLSSFAWYKECMIWRISFSKFLDILPTFTCSVLLVIFEPVKFLAVNIISIM